ncbi:hypothetical protein E1B28_001797 [Marasmius oreades]|uniref:Uncharacterized protein n=1 Tax=Marasmius oreades TaxID=181124 RepID=A0A9P7V493_9AGAR|nr:uncharacterized protein E1B28_001797 [Marasmius oreades]KAG7100010.1 hypothetical protein E1B28_001797 [Marasmius oreades]
MTLDEINKTLSLDYMLQHEPFGLLPAQYFPDEESNHYPPIFDYGFALTDEQASDYAREQGLIPVVRVECSADQDPWSIISWRISNIHIQRRFGTSDARQESRNCFTIYPQRRGVTHGRKVPCSRKKVNKLLDMMKQAFKMRPTWHLSRENRGRLQDNYYLDRISPSLQWGMEVLSSLPQRKDEAASEIIDTP